MFIFSAIFMCLKKTEFYDENKERKWRVSKKRQATSTTMKFDATTIRNERHKTTDE